MSDLFDFEPVLDAYAVIGNPIKHSQSPYIHHYFAQQAQQAMVYEAMCVDEGGFAQALGNFQASGGKGLNVTVPFKRDAWQCVDELTPRAQRAGAVNTIICRAEGQCVGDNTDGAGLLRDLSVNLEMELLGTRILLLGAGGAIRGVLGPLLDACPDTLTVANRSVTKAEALVAEFRDRDGPSGVVLRACGLDELSGQSFDLVVNGTAASLKGKALRLSDGLFHGAATAYDMMYGARPSPFMVWARTHGADRAVDGLGMLVEQAAESFLLWRGLRPATAGVIEQLRQRLSAL